jgi:DNA modification methylase
VSTATYLVGDVFERMAQLPDGSVDLVVTSPPFLALRSYLPADHPDKAKEIGSEPTPAEFLQTLLELTAEWGRLLTPHGSIAVELGDTYAGSGGAGGDYSPDGLRDGQPAFGGSAKVRRTAGDYPIRDDIPRPNRSGRTRADGNGKVFRGGERGPDKQGSAWPMEKSLCGIPEAYMLSLAYGYNVLDRRGPDSPAGRWRVRNMVAWVRPNPPVGALADKFRPATSYITVATRARDRWFDLDAVRQPLSAKTLTVADGTPPSAKNNGSPSGHHRQDRLNNPAGAPPLDWWEITPGGYAGAHYAVFPAELPKRLIDSMCPRKVCTTCGEPSRRITERPDALGRTSSVGHASGGLSRRPKSETGYRVPDNTTVITTGWSDCGHDTWRPGLVLDPFAGSGTTLAVASGMARDSIGIDLDSRNADLARNRVGMFLTVDDPAGVSP